MAKGRLVLSIEEAGRLVFPFSGRSAWYEAAASGRLPARKIGRRWVVPVPELARVLGITVEDVLAALERINGSDKE